MCDDGSALSTNADGLTGSATGDSDGVEAGWRAISTRSRDDRLAGRARRSDAVVVLRWATVVGSATGSDRPSARSVRRLRAPVGRSHAPLAVRTLRSTGARFHPFRERRQVHRGGAVFTAVSHGDRVRLRQRIRRRHLDPEAAGWRHGAITPVTAAVARRIAGAAARFVDAPHPRPPRYSLADHPVALGPPSPKTKVDDG